MNSNGLLKIPHARKLCSTHPNDEACDEGGIYDAPPSPGAQESSVTGNEQKRLALIMLEERLCTLRDNVQLSSVSLNRK